MSRLLLISLFLFLSAAPALAEDRRPADDLRLEQQKILARKPPKFVPPPVQATPIQNVVPPSTTLPKTLPAPLPPPPG